MAKKKEGQTEIDFVNMSPDVDEKVRKATKIVSEYMSRQREEAESIRITLADLATDLDANKRSEKRLKKTVRTAAAAILKQSARSIRDDNEATERLLEKLGEL